MAAASSVDLYRSNEPGNTFGSILVLDAGYPLSKAECEYLDDTMWRTMPYCSVVDNIYDPPEFFDRGIAYKLICEVDRRLLPQIHALFEEALWDLVVYGQ
jgi:hypothetical protein